MSTDELLAEVTERGFALELAPDGAPRLKGPAREATEALIAVLRLPVHRDEIRRRLRAELGTPREWLVPQPGGGSPLVFVERLPSTDPAGHLRQATHWRRQGEAEWLEIVRQTAGAPA